MPRIGKFGQANSKIKSFVDCARQLPEKTKRKKSRPNPKIHGILGSYQENAAEKKFPGIFKVIKTPLFRETLASGKATGLAEQKLNKVSR